MKKIFILSIFFSVILYSKAQSTLEIFDLQNNNISYDTITIDGLTSDNEVDFYAHVKNISGSNHNYICRKTVISNDGTSMNMFCFGPNCYTGQESNPVTIGAGVIDTTFHGYVYPSGSEGITAILYTFYNSSDSLDTVNVFVKFNLTTPSGINLSNVLNTSISTPYPLPANRFINFNYHLAQGDEASIVFYDILGTEVKRYSLSSASNQIRINTLNLNTGIFIYALVVNGKKIKMGRLMIKH